MKPLTEAELEMMTGFNANPHPDDKPWDKCCGTKQDCLCAMRKVPAGDRIFGNPISAAENRVDFMLRSDDPRSQVEKGQMKNIMAENGRFFCVHRKTDDGYHRECAGWAAKYHPEKRHEGS